MWHAMTTGSAGLMVALDIGIVVLGIIVIASCMVQGYRRQRRYPAQYDAYVLSGGTLTFRQWYTHLA